MLALFASTLSAQTFGKQGSFGQDIAAYDGPQPFDMLHYRLDVSLALLTDALQGKSTITMRLKSAIDSVVLNAVGLQFDTVRVDGVAKNISMNTASETFTILLGGTRNPGDTLHIEIAYQRISNYPRPGGRVGYNFFRDTLGLPSNLGYTFSEPSIARFWMPCYDEPWEKASAEMNITVPAGYVAASNGKLVGVTNNGNGTVTWGWKEDHQIATYLMCMTATVFTISSIPYVTATNDTIPLQYYAWNADSVACANYLPTVHQMVSAYAGFYGEYPFDKYGMTVVVPFQYLGMEHQSITTLNRYGSTSERVVSHELAHQWWGDLVTCGTWADIWLNESFATYSEALWKQHLGGLPGLKNYMKDSVEHFFFGSWQGAVYDPVGQGFNLFDDLVYGKGAWVLHTLRGVVGDPVFFGILHAYRQRYSGKSAITSEFKAVADSAVGMDMSWFFNEWIFGPGWPKYASSFTWAADTLSLIIYQQQLAAWPTYKMPITLRAHHGGGATDFVVWDSLRAQSFRFPLSVQPDSITIDPDGWILKQIVPPPSGVDERQTASSFQLFQNFPNPFNPATTIEYSLPEAGHVSLKVFDMLGKEVATLVHEHQQAGGHVIPFDGAGLSSGVYVYRITVGSTTFSRKMTLMK